MSVEISCMWHEYAQSLPKDEVDGFFSDNNLITDNVLLYYGDIVDEYQLFVATGGKVSLPYPRNHGRKRK